MVVLYQVTHVVYSPGWVSTCDALGILVLGDRGHCFGHRIQTDSHLNLPEGVWLLKGTLCVVDQMSLWSTDASLDRGSERYLVDMGGGVYGEGCEGGEGGGPYLRHTLCSQQDTEHSVCLEEGLPPSPPPTLPIHPTTHDVISCVLNTA